MSTRKKVSFGSKSSMVETWIVDDAAETRKKCGDVREIGGGFCDDTMTSASDIMVINKTTNHKLPNRHVTIGDSTIVVMTPDTSPDTPDYEGVHTLYHNTGTSSSSTNTTSNINHNDNSSSEARVPFIQVTRPTPDRPTTSQTNRPPSEEYFDVLNPVPKDQTHYDDEEEPRAGQYETSQTYDLASPDDPVASYVVDSYTGWPLKRSQSLESRDNPFLPGGDLSREAEDLLSKATIIRDHFYLNEEQKRTLKEQQQQQLEEQQQQQQQQKQQRGTKHVQIVDHQDGRTHSTNSSARAPSSPPPPAAVEERISPQSTANTHAAAVSVTAPNGGDNHQLQPKENGKVGDSAAASPDSVKIAIPDGDGQSLPQSQTGPGGGATQTSPSGGEDLQVHDSDKKRRNKCCSVM